jgi:hypothetical protein
MNAQRFANYTFRISSSKLMFGLNFEAFHLRLWYSFVCESSKMHPDQPMMQLQVHILVRCSVFWRVDLTMGSHMFHRSPFFLLKNDTLFSILILRPWIGPVSRAETMREQRFSKLQLVAWICKQGRAKPSNICSIGLYVWSNSVQTFVVTDSCRWSYCSS